MWGHLNIIIGIVHFSSMHGQRKLQQRRNKKGHSEFHMTVLSLVGFITPQRAELTLSSAMEVNAAHMPFLDNAMLVQARWVFAQGGTLSRVDPCPDLRLCLEYELLYSSLMLLDSISS